jgi:hypothetical protein
MVNSVELTGTTESLTLQTRYSIKRCRYNRIQLYLPMHVGLCIQRELEVLKILSSAAAFAGLLPLSSCGLPRLASLLYQNTGMILRNCKLFQLHILMLYL